MDLSTELLKRLGARQVGCLKEMVIRHNIMLPQYTIVWTEMNLEGAPKDTIIGWKYFNGKNILSTNISQELVTIIEKIE